MSGARRLGAVAALAALAVAGTACSIPTQGDPSAIPASRVPANILDPHLPTTTTTQPRSVVPVQVFFVNSANQQLQSEQRVVPPPASLTSIIAALLAGPTSTELASVNTAIPNDVSVISATQGPGNVVVVNMNNAFGEITGNNQELAVGQIVATVATEVGFGSGNHLGPGVVFEIDGQRIPVPTAATGSDVNGPVYLIQYLGGPAGA